MSTASSRRLALVLSLLVAGGALAALATGLLGSNLVYYWNPTELLEAGDVARGASVRLGGMVKPGSVTWDEASGLLTFAVQDEQNEVEVRSKGVPPEMFREGIGAVLEGTMGDDGVFEARRLLVKHDNQYRAPDGEGHGSDPFSTVEGL